MSRTIRRIKSKDHHSYFFSDYIDGELDEKSFDVVFWRYHRDSKKYYGWVCGKEFFAEAEATARAKNKQEIVRYMKNEDYEVVNHFPRDVSWD